MNTTMLEFELCECGCGKYTKSGKKFINGHSMRGRKNLGSSAYMKTKRGNKHPWFGKKHTKDTLIKLSKSKIGKNNPNFGKKLPWISKIMKTKTGENNHNWRGGSSFELYPTEFNKKLKSKIREKFNHKCALCEKPAKIPHHIDYNKKNNKEDNFVLLCRNCNGKVNFNRNQWETGFKIFVLGSIYH